MRQHAGKIAIACGTGVLGILGITLTFPATRAEHLLALQAVVMLSFAGIYSYRQWKQFRDARGRYGLIGTEGKQVFHESMECKFI